MIKLNYSNSMADATFKKGLKEEKLKIKNENVFKKVVINTTRPMMDWVGLPYQKKQIVDEIQTYGRKVAKNFDNFIVIGIGGSALGTKAVKQALYDNAKGKKIKIDVIDNIDAESFESILSTLPLKKTMFNIVTKSGNTVEILSLFACILDKVKSASKEYSENFVVTTEKDNMLWNFCVKNNIKTFDVPKGVGGRYSVLCSVGLLPMAVMGLDLNKILSGAKYVLENYKQESFDKSLCMITALLMYNYFVSGKKEFVILPYSNRLNLMADFYIQLLSESLGKKNLLTGKPNKLFFSPTKAEGVVYQHSLLQMYQEGAHDRLFFFLTLDEHNSDMKVPVFNDEKLDALLPESLTQLFVTEQIASSLALKQAGHPSFEISVPVLDEENIGALLYYFELTTCLIAEFMGVNGYDQNGVELQKKYTKAMIGVAGYEKEKQQLSSLLENKNKYEI